VRLFPIKRHPIKEEDDDDELDERPTVHEEEMWSHLHHASFICSPHFRDLERQKTTPLSVEKMHNWR
jgi:hypothetical protein